MTIWNVIVLAAMAQGFLLTFVLLTKKGNRRANVFLALLVLLFSIDIGLETLYASPLILDYPHFIGINDVIYFLFGPLLYLYAYFLTSSIKSFFQKQIIHFAPFLLVLLFYIPTLFLQSADVKLFSEGHITATVTASFINTKLRGQVELASAFHQFIYVILTIFLIKNHQQAIKDSFSAIERINLKWLRNLTLATGIIVLLDISLYFLVESQYIEFTQAVSLILFFSAALIYAIGYMGLMQPEIFSDVEEVKVTEKESIDEELEVTEKYSKSGLSEEQADENLAKLLDLMETEKLYLDGELKLSDVAAEIGISNNKLSQIINEKVGKNFYDFINSYRVETAKKLLADPEKNDLTLLAICYDSGFNSKSSFNSVFKKHCEMTPSQYKKSI